jgi:hypothetical protein
MALPLFCFLTLAIIIAPTHVTIEDTSVKVVSMDTASFKVKPTSESDVHQAALSMKELDKIFCIREERTLRNNFTIAYNGKLYQIKDAVKTQKVAVEERMDGSLHITHRGLDLRYREIKIRPVKEKLEKPLLIERKYQPADHPWKRLRRASVPLPVAS